MHEINSMSASHIGADVPGGYKMQVPGLNILMDTVTKKILYFDEKFTEFFGYTAGEIKSDSFSLASIIDATQMDRLNIQIQELYENKTNKFIAYHIKHSNDSIVVCYIYGYLAEDPAAIQNIVQLYIQPEFSKKETPFISSDTRELFLDLFNSLDYGTFEWIISTNKIFWSEGIYKIYDIDSRKESFDYAFVHQFTHPDDRERVTAIMNEAVVAQSEYDIELRIITEAGTEKIIHVIGKTISGMDGNPLKLIGSVRDVTSQRAIEKSLEIKVQELNKSNAELEEFAYIASHDLQEPLRKISTFCDRLSDKYVDILPEDGRMYLERITSSADNMRMLIHNLLEFSRVSKTNEPYMPVSLDIIIREVANDFELLIEETGTTINVSQLPKVHSSVVLMKQLFSNLVNNAIKFRKQDIRAKINISSAILPGAVKARFGLDMNTDYVDIRVEDNGIGFDNEYASRIFDIFQRLHGKADYPGSGIGLAICKKIAEKHNGHIYAEGTENIGAIFHIILPRDAETQ